MVNTQTLALDERISDLSENFDSEHFRKHRDVAERRYIEAESPDEFLSARIGYRNISLGVPHIKMVYVIGRGSYKEDWSDEKEALFFVPDWTVPKDRRMGNDVRSIDLERIDSFDVIE